MKFRTYFLIVSALISSNLYSQSCTPQGDQTTYGTNGKWIGYVYQGINFNTYKGYVNEGAAANPNFDESFGGTQVNYNTNGCNAYTDTFSVRYKLTQTFTDGNYTITVGGDDGFRLSLDGGATWVINQWVLQGYTTSSYNVHLSGSYNMVLEYYENFGSNRVSFNVVTTCGGSGDPSAYGTNGKWIGYVYSGMNFNLYRGYVTEGATNNPNFTEGFGGDNVSYATSDCSINTTQFSVRYRSTQVLSTGKYVITVGGDDGYRLSLDGGSTYVINKWADQSYNITSYTATLSGSYNMVLEYYENGGQNTISFNMTNSTLPLDILSFTAENRSQNVSLVWKAAAEVSTDYFTVQRSADGYSYTNIGQIQGTGLQSADASTIDYNYVDRFPLGGTSYYRLMMTGVSGKISYSKVVTVANSAATTGNQEVKVFPTVIQNNTINVAVAKQLPQAKVELYNMNGVKVSERSFAVLSGTQTVSASNASPGNYILKLSSNGEQVYTQLVMVVR